MNEIVQYTDASRPRQDIIVGGDVLPDGDTTTPPDYFPPVDLVQIDADNDTSPRITPLIDLHDEDERIDREADKLGSYYLGAVAMGIEEPRRSAAKGVQPRTPAAPRKQSRVSTGPQYGDNGSIETPDGEPYYFKQHQLLSEEQLEINRRGIKLVRAVLAEAARRRQGDSRPL